jgi:hypothetical protein
LISGEDDSLEPLGLVLSSCQIVFKILLGKVQHVLPMMDGASSSGKGLDLWPTSDIEVLSQSVSKIASGLHLLIEAFNLYDAMCCHTPI